MSRRSISSRPAATAVLVMAALVALPAPATVGGSQHTVAFLFTYGVQTWTVPANVYQATFELAGARGGIGLVQSQPGLGARVIATIAVTPGETLQVNVGGQGGNSQHGQNRSDSGAGKGGWNGGGDGGRGLGDGNGPFLAPGGGGATDIRRDPGGQFPLADRILVAGGGGGNSYHTGHTFEPPKGLGGDGGGLQGDAGVPGRSGGAGGCFLDVAGGINATDLGQGDGGGSGGGGTGGAGGVGGEPGAALGNGETNSAGKNGVLGKGGDGGDAFGCGGFDGGGGGGGGHHGGGGGGGASLGNGGGGGGGGSSDGPSGAAYTVGHNNGSGYVNIAYTPGDPPPAATRRPDARIRGGTSATFAGNDVYNITGTRQSKSGSAAKGGTITFTFSAQNDGTAAEKLIIKATGTATSGYTIKYLKGAMDITAAVVAGTWKTAVLAPGAESLITVKVLVRPAAVAGSKVVRTLTVTSAHDGMRKDVAKVTGKQS